MARKTQKFDIHQEITNRIVDLQRRCKGIPGIGLAPRTRGRCGMSRTYSLSPFVLMKGALHASRRAVLERALRPLQGVRQILGQKT